MDHNNILAVVLAGGKSQRFGQDKSQVKFQGKMLIDHILSEIIDQFNETLIVTNKKINFMNSNKISITKDFKENLGPLGGVLSAMKWIKTNNRKYNWISTFPSDTPFFTKKELKTFYEKIKINDSKLFFVKSQKTIHNIFGVWSLELINQLEIDLLAGKRKVEDWAKSVGVSIIEIEYKSIDPFFNINTKKDLDEALRIAKNDKL